MNKKKRISIYLRNKDITPSSYYRITQYTKFFSGDVLIREIAPKKIYLKQLNLEEKEHIKKYVIGAIYYLTMLVRVYFFLIFDSILKPEYVIVSRTFCPRYTPLILRALISHVAKSSTLYWDFDDYIFENCEISEAQANILEKYSKNIIVTNDFLKSKIKDEYQNKVVLLPTTDGDMLGFDETALVKQRMKSFKHEIRLVWVATSSNMPNLIKIIKVLDVAAETIKKVFDKKLVLTVVCNKPCDNDVKSLVIRNIEWNREVAIEEIFDAHIGIMPLINNDYSIGKGGFKLVQYISTGLPVIASKVGFNEEVVDDDCGILVDDEFTNDGWIDAILEIIDTEDTWERYSVGALKRWVESFSFGKNLELWNRLLNGEEVVV